MIVEPHHQGALTDFVGDDLFWRVERIGSRFTDQRADGGAEWPPKALESKTAAEPRMESNDLEHR